MRFLLTFTFSLVTFACFAQKDINSDELSNTPFFLQKKLKVADTLFQKDLSVLKKHITFDDVDTAILKPNLLYFLMAEKATDTLANYQTLINTVTKFKNDIGYNELRKGIILYREMANLTVNPSNWQQDQTLFRRLGFTEADLEDFLLFISKPENKELNYRAAYMAYMKEIESL
jgi:hypothetical protein